MTQNDFIKNFVLVHPRLYVRLISYNFPLTADTLIKYGYLLSWDQYGLLGNSRIKWTDNLKTIFSKRLPKNHIAPATQGYLMFDPNSAKTEIPDISLNTNLYSPGPKEYYLKFSELSLDRIRTYKERIQNWSTISYYYNQINFDFINEFKHELNLHDLLLNPSIEWSDTRLFSFFPNQYDILRCEHVWTKFINFFATPNTIQKHFEAFNDLDKFVQINWKLDERNKDNTIKYLLSIYAKSGNEYQIMTSGYYRTERDYPIGEQIEIGKDFKFPLKDDYVFPQTKIAR